MNKGNSYLHNKIYNVAQELHVPLQWCIFFMLCKSCAQLVNSWARVVCVLIISCVAEHVHVQTDNSHYVIVLFHVVTCSTDAEPVCQAFKSSLLCHRSARVHEKVMCFQRHVTPGRESRDTSTFTSPELCAQVVK